MKKIFRALTLCLVLLSLLCAAVPAAFAAGNKEDAFYTIGLDACGGVSSTVVVTTNLDGKLTTLPESPTMDGYTFNGWTSGSNVVFRDPNAAETTFTMPEGSVTVTANWSRDGGSSSSGRDDSDPSYAVGIPDKMENGSVSVSPKNASQGDRVTVTVKPDAGYELDSLKVFDKNGKELELTDKGDGRFTFIMPAGKVEVKATFTEEVKTSPFQDVPTDAYYYEAVKWAQKKGITGGIGLIGMLINKHIERKK